MYIKANYFGNNEILTSKQIRHVLDLLDAYVKEDYSILEIRKESYNDKNDRIDVEIGIKTSTGQLISQKLLILKDEVIDGLTFHKRFHEWYD